MKIIFLFLKFIFYANILKWLKKYKNIINLNKNIKF
jgi:hypothetical protein